MKDVLKMLDQVKEELGMILDTPNINHRVEMIECAAILKLYKYEVKIGNRLIEGYVLAENKRDAIRRAEYTDMFENKSKDASIYKVIDSEELRQLFVTGNCVTDWDYMGSY